MRQTYRSAVDDYVPTQDGVRTDLCNAGANVVDQEVATDGNLTTSRSPADLPAFCRAIVEAFARVGTGGGAR